MNCAEVKQIAVAGNDIVGFGRERAFENRNVGIVTNLNLQLLCRTYKLRQSEKTFYDVIAFGLAQIKLWTIQNIFNFVQNVITGTQSNLIFRDRFKNRQWSSAINIRRNYYIRIKDNYHEFRNFCSLRYAFISAVISSIVMPRRRISFRMSANWSKECLFKYWSTALLSTTSRLNFFIFANLSISLPHFWNTTKMPTVASIVGRPELAEANFSHILNRYFALLSEPRTKILKKIASS
ncbi:MAG: hypothetical protein LDLANPLL_00159 [Turneriella sp.]|nr:hypothetical protein [Turneriella sp.]